MKTLPVAVQVYSVRDQAEKDFKGTMEQLKAMGYDGVELAGLYSYSKEAVKSILNEVGLEPVSAHVPLQDMQADIDSVIETYKYIGCKYIVVPYLMEGNRPGDEAFKQTLKDIIRCGEACTAAEMTLLYHNHDFEFIKLEDGTFALDDLYNKTTPDQLQAEPDTCWIKVAGQDPAAYVRKYAGRVPIVHLKDFFKEGQVGSMYELIGLEAEEDKGSGVFEFRPVGHGMQDFKPILEASIDAHAKWVVVEQDEPSGGHGRLESVKMSRDYLKTLGW